jgi:PBSX family phage terminase large subunit
VTTSWQRWGMSVQQIESELLREVELPFRVARAATYGQVRRKVPTDPRATLRGGALRLWDGTTHEAMLAGPAETGKTWACCLLVHRYLTEHPGAQALMLRKTFAALVPSAVQTYKRATGKVAEPYGGEKPEWFDYPNGSRLWVAGLDNPGKALSTERDIIYVNQAEELTLDDWETLSTRTTGRAAVMPFTRIFGDCNPRPPSHWIKHREGLELLESRHEDNPTLFTDNGALTEQGRKTMAVLDALTGVRKERLRYGRWRQAEGAVYEEWDRAVHVVSAGKRAEVLAAAKSFVGGIDWGYTNPGVLQVWAVDGDGRMVLVREVYRTGKLDDWWLEECKALTKEFNVSSWHADPSEPGFIKKFRNAQIPVREGQNDIAPGIQAVAARLPKAADGRARLYVLEDALADRDEELAASRKPLGLVDEMEQYSWPKAQDGKVNKEKPIDDSNHAEDACRYVAMALTRNWKPWAR